MITEEKEVKNYFLKEFSLFDGEYDVILNIVDINFDKMTITVNVSRAGKLYLQEFDLKRDRENDLYFQYGIDNTNIKVDDFETISD